MGRHARRATRRQHERETPIDDGRDEGERPYGWIVYAFAMVFAGALMGYVLSWQGMPATAGSTPAPVATTAAPPTALVNESTLAAYRNILARDPTNVEAAISAGNLLYDARRYQEAIPLYQQAFALRPSDINVSTDLGTALWYTGRADEALAQYKKSLALNPTHPQTLFNIGIVNADGKRAYADAIASWEKLLATNPGYGDVVKVRSLIAGARQQPLSSASGSSGAP